MLKRASAIAMVGVVLALMQVGETNAHGILIGSKWYYHSLGNDVTFKGVKQDGNTIWVANIEEWQFLCFNPADNTAALQVMLRDRTLSASQDFEDGNWDKKKGKLDQTATFDTGSLVSDVTCETTPGGGHHNWIPKPETVLITKFHGVITTYDTNGQVISTTTEDNCELMGPYDAANHPLPGTAYQCDAPHIVH